MRYQQRYIVKHKELKAFSLFEYKNKQTLLESLSINDRKSKLENILKTYLLDEFGNNTLQ